VPRRQRSLSSVESQFRSVETHIERTFVSSRVQARAGAFQRCLRFDEKKVQDNGSLETLRMLNGEETRSGAFCIMPNEDPDCGGMPICVTIPARTMIAAVEVYALEDDEA
jgi:hypothetical protein